MGNTPLLYAVYGGHLELVKSLLQNHCNLEEKNNKGHSAIIQASCGGHSDLVQWLIGNGTIRSLPLCSLLSRSINGF